ncbi:MAG: hypothetical protein MUF06_24680 [Pirellulaceae bacterium]|nr:hypothetical protein [Pirellulaceae bacterium]
MKSLYQIRPALMLAIAWPLIAFLAAAQANEPAGLETAYRAEIQPLLKSYCYECHSDDTQEAEIDLAAFTDLAAIRQQTKVWQRIAEMLAARGGCPGGRSGARCAAAAQQRGVYVHAARSDGCGGTRSGPRVSRR